MLVFMHQLLALYRFWNIVSGRSPRKMAKKNYQGVKDLAIICSEIIHSIAAVSNINGEKLQGWFFSHWMMLQKKCFSLLGKMEII